MFLTLNHICPNTSPSPSFIRKGKAYIKSDLKCILKH